MRSALVALLLLPIVASAQDMPLFTFTKSGEGWVKAEGKAPEGNSTHFIVAGGNLVQITYTRLEVPRHSLTVRNEPGKPKGQPGANIASADGNTVYVGFSDDSAVWAFTPDKDNKLTNGAPYAPLRVRKEYDNSKDAREKLKASPPALAVHELALDTAGRLYAATSQDLQVFDPTGRLSGVLTLPAKGKVEAMAWEGKEKDTLAMWIDGKKWTRAMKP